MLKHNLPVEILGDPPPPKGDPIELKPLHDNLKYAYLDEEEIYPVIFLVLGSPQDNFRPIIFGRPFLNTVHARIDCEKDVVTIGLGDMSHEFNFSKFHRQHCEEELPSKDEIIGLASIVVPPSDPLEQYLLEHENDMFMNERREIDEVFFKQASCVSE